MRKITAMPLATTLSVSLPSGCVSTSQNTTTVQSAKASSADISPTDSSSADKTSKSTAGSSVDSAPYTIGAEQFAEHGSLNSCHEGFTTGLEEEGIEEGMSLVVFYDNSQADGGTASQITTNFVGKDVDLVCGIATPMAQAKHGMAKRSGIPVIFTTVADPVTVRLANTDGASVNEATGANNKLPVRAQLEMIHEIPSEIKSTGTIYTTSEANPESIIAEYKELAPRHGLETVDTDISSFTDIVLAVDTLINKVDCITNLTDNAVTTSLLVILDKATAKNIPVFGNEIGQVKIGCLATIGLDYTELGRQTGETAVQVLRGERKANEMNHETIKETTFYGNTRVAGNLDITLLEDLTKNTVEPFTEIAQ